MANRYSVVDLFCGIGGLSYGFRQEKFKVIAGIDIDKSCQYPFERNNQSKFYHEDLSLLPSEFVNNLFPRDTISRLCSLPSIQHLFPKI